MKDMLDRLDRLFGYDSEQMVLEKPTLIMDRGIATQDNIMLLWERGYPYVVVTREDQSTQYLEEFETARETFTCINELSHKYSAYGDESRDYVKKITSDDVKTCKILCLSDGKARKERAIAEKKDKPFVERITKLNQSILKGNIKKTEKIAAKLNKIKQSYTAASEKYITTLVMDEAGKVLRLDISHAVCEPNPLDGCYVIESTHTELDEVQTWRLYMTQVNVECAFRSMKGELGMRPVFHQNEKRTAAHLFITVLAYHVLSVIERCLERKNDSRLWKTLREVLSTHCRNTIALTDQDGNIYHRRVTGKPEAAHCDIYNKLNIIDPVKTVTYTFK
jgi:transposase